MKQLTLLELLQSGAHFGHKTSKWHPKMKPYIYGTRGGVHILDLEKTREGLEKAGKAAADIASMGGTILFVGTKKQSREIVQKAAESCGMPFVVTRWLGGTFTNFRTIQKTIKRMEKLKNDQASPDFNTRFTKKERLLIEREVAKMSRLLAGIQNMRKLPDAVFVASVHHDAIAVEEAKKSRVKVIGVADSNTDPKKIDVIIPSNDDAVDAIGVVAKFLAESINEGKSRYGSEQVTSAVAVDVSDTEEKK